MNPLTKETMIKKYIEKINFYVLLRFKFSQLPNRLDPLHHPQTRSNYGVSSFLLLKKMIRFWLKWCVLYIFKETVDDFLFYVMFTDRSFLSHLKLKRILSGQTTNLIGQLSPKYANF